MGTQPPSQKGVGGRAQSPPVFGPWQLWPNGWMDQGATWHGGRPWSSPHCAGWGHSSLPKRGTAPSPQIFGPSLLWPNGWMHQGATCYGGRPRELCSMWTQLPPEKGHTHSHPMFGPCLLWPNGWMDEDAAWYGSRPWLRPHCIRRGPSSRERGTAPPSFRPMSIVATVVYLSYC